MFTEEIAVIITASAVAGGLVTALVYVYLVMPYSRWRVATFDRRMRRLAERAEAFAWYEHEIERAHERLAS